MERSRARQNPRGVKVPKSAINSNPNGTKLNFFRFAGCLTQFELVVV